MCNVDSSAKKSTILIFHFQNYLYIFSFLKFQSFLIYLYEKFFSEKVCTITIHITSVIVQYWSKKSYILNNVHSSNFVDLKIVLVRVWHFCDYILDADYFAKDQCKNTSTQLSKLFLNEQKFMNVSIEKCHNFSFFKGGRAVLYDTENIYPFRRRKLIGQCERK